MFALTVLLKAIGAIVTFLVLRALVKHLQTLYYLHKLPGIPSEGFFWGNIKSLNTTPEGLFKVARARNKKYYPICKSWIAWFGAAEVMNPYDFENIMTKVSHNKKGTLYNMMHLWLGTGLLTSEGVKWQTRRRILTPAFHFSILKEFVDTFHDETVKFVDRLKRECHNPYVEVTSLISDFTLNSIGETSMGTSFSTDTSDGRRYKQAILDIGRLYHHKIVRPWLINKFIYALHSNYWAEIGVVKTLHQFTSDIIREREKNHSGFQAGQREKRLAMLDLLLKAKHEGSIDDEGIREEVDTFMFEGHDTTAVAIGFALMMIACHPEVQGRLTEEIVQILSPKPKPDYNNLQNLKYMDCVLKEVLRMYPSVPFIARLLGEDMVMHSGHLLKKGTMLHMHIYDVHHNPEFFPEPEKFDPDRFSPENSQNIHNFAYLPFSAGFRNCIGQRFALLELKSVLSGILAEFALEPVDTPASIELITDLVLRTKRSIRVKFVQREQNLLFVC